MVKWFEWKWNNFHCGWFWKPLNNLTVKGADSDAEYYDHVVSTYQSNITVSGGKIKGTLKYVEGGLAPSGYLSGSGYFLALSLYDNNFSGYDSVKVGLKPSQGSGLVEIINDPDKVIVMKITDIKKQKFKIVSSKSGHPDNTQVFSLSELTLTE